MPMNTGAPTAAPWRAIQRSCFGLPRATPITSALTLAECLGGGWSMPPSASTTGASIADDVGARRALLEDLRRPAPRRLARRRTGTGASHRRRRGRPAPARDRRRTCARGSGRRRSARPTRCPCRPGWPGRCAAGWPARSGRATALTTKSTLTVTTWWTRPVARPSATISAMRSMASGSVTSSIGVPSRTTLPSPIAMTMPRRVARSFRCGRCGPSPRRPDGPACAATAAPSTTPSPGRARAIGRRTTAPSPARARTPRGRTAHRRAPTPTWPSRAGAAATTAVPATATPPVAAASTDSGGTRWSSAPSMARDPPAAILAPPAGPAAGT